MEKLAELKEKLKELSPEELEEVKAYLSTEETKTAETEDKKEETVEETKEEEKVEPTSEETADETAPTGTEQTEESPVTEETTEEADKTTEAEDVATEETKAENEGTEEAVQESVTEPEEDDIPLMTKGEPAGEPDTVDEDSITAETGEDLPIDYEQIVEGLNAKIAALEAENASLKNKVNGAFGYSSKPTIPTKVNRLYDECEDVHFHK